MSIQKYKVSKNEGNFTTFPNKVLQNLRNMEALGLYCYLLSLPHGWEFHKNHLRKHAGFGINKLNSLIKILEEHGLIKTVQVRNEKGRFAHFDLQVNDGTAFIHKEFEQSCAPLPENRDTENRDTENSTYKRKTVQKKDLKKDLSNISASDDAHENEPSAFEIFWHNYPVKKNKMRARKIWERKKLDKIATLISDDLLNRKLNDSAWSDLQFIPHPSTYLQNERWEDAISTFADKKPKGNGSDALSRVIKKNLQKGDTYDHTTGRNIDPFR